MSLLDIVRDAAVLVGIGRPAAVASSPDTTLRQMMLLASLAGEEIAKWHDWSGLSASGSITGDGATTSWALPADFDRFGQDRRVVLDGAGVPIAGPPRPDEIAASRPSLPRVFHRRGDRIETAPALAAGRQGFYAYQSANWVVAADGGARAEFGLDGDTVAAFPERLVMLGLVWRWKQVKGLDHAQEYETWRARLELEAARDGDMRPVASGPAPTDLPDPLVPDTIGTG